MTEGKANEFTEEILKDNFSTAQGEEKYLVRPVVIDAVLAGVAVSVIMAFVAALILSKFIKAEE